MVPNGQPAAPAAAPAAPAAAPVPAQPHGDASAGFGAMTDAPLVSSPGISSHATAAADELDRTSAPWSLPTPSTQPMCLTASTSTPSSIMATMAATRLASITTLRSGRNNSPSQFWMWLRLLRCNHLPSTSHLPTCLTSYLIYPYLRYLWYLLSLCIFLLRFDFTKLGWLFWADNGADGAFLK